METYDSAPNDTKQPVFEMHSFKSKRLPAENECSRIMIVDFQKDAIAPEGDDQSNAYRHDVGVNQPFLPEIKLFVH